ncbi:E2F/DP_family winged-helix DNA-binding domain-containing protein [Hexamita inflata]|uniref:E2F/DP_family winged-helix DNA-binding domain-containing protein n=1 Tax=Hexamita inflata TaxID=28002 RepID=A0ABP1IAV9_9EUKA
MNSADANTLQIVNYLLLTGQSTVEAVSASTGISDRRVYDILNTLSSTPLVTKRKIGVKTVFVFGNGTKYTENVDVSEILLLIEGEQRMCVQLIQQLGTL